MKLNKKIKRTFFEHKSQYIGAIVLILFSCMLYTTFNIMGSNIIRNLDLYITNNIQEDAYFISANNINNISQLEKKYNVILEKRGSFNFNYSDQSTLKILSATSKIDKYSITEGSDLKNDNDLLIDPGFARAHKIKIGDTINFYGQTFYIVGFACTPDYIYPLKNPSDLMKNPNAFGIGIISKAAFDKINHGYSFYSIKFKDDNIDKFKTEIKKNYSIISWVDKADNMRMSFIQGDINGIKPIGTSLPISILLVTCVMVAVILTRLLKREYTQIGVLYSLGYRKNEILRHYMLYPIILASIGGISGTILGTFMVKPFVAYISTFYNLPTYKIDFQINSLIFSILIPFIFLVPLAYIVINKALNLSPLNLIKGGIDNNKVNFIERTLKLKNFKFTNKFKIREVVRNIPRTFLLLAGVVCASWLLLIGFSTRTSMNYLLNQGIEATYHYNYVYSFNNLQVKNNYGGEKILVYPFKITKSDKKENTAIYGVQTDNKLITMQDLKGNSIDFNKTIITKSLSDKYNINIGDNLVVEDKMTSKKYTLKIDDIANYYLSDLIFMPIEKLNTMLGYDKNSYIQIYSKDKLSIPDSELVSVTNRKYIQESYQELMKPLLAMAGLLGIMAFIVGIVILYVVTSLLIEENKKTISLLKVFGYPNKKLYQLILNPYTIFVIIGYAISIPIIIKTLDNFFKAMTVDMSMSIPTMIDKKSVILGFIIIFATYEFNKWLNRRKINRVSINENLSSARE